MNDDPHPRVLFENVPDELFAELEPLVATARSVGVGEAVPELEWDAIVTFSSSPCDRSTHLHVLSFGGTNLDMVRVKDRGRTAMRRDYTSIGEVLRIPETVEKDVRRLIETSILPNLQRIGTKSVWGRKASTGQYAPVIKTDDLGGACRPFIHVGTERSVLALERTRPGKSNALCWALPSETTQHVEWFKLFLSRLGRIDPDRFSVGPDWQTSETWATPEALQAAKQLTLLEEERIEALHQIDKKIAEAKATLDAVKSSATRGAHRLLTESGDELVEAVMQALQAVGFVVSEMDASHTASTGARLEDLRVIDPNDSTWVCLVEVKGYTNGVKVNDIPRITQRPCTQYAIETGRAPSAVWFIANHHRSIHPGQRPKFVGNPDADLAVLANVDGAGIDTRDLFRLWRDVATKEIEQSTAVKSLKSAVRQWTWN